MTSPHNEPDEDLRARAARILHTMDDTPIPAMDALFHAHYAQELRLIVEEFLDQPAPTESAAPDRVWLVWDCTDLAGVFATANAALEARADAQHQLLCQYGPDIEVLETITITDVALTTSPTTHVRCDR